jgi:hypothetical protein
VRRLPAVFAPPKLDSHHPGQGLGICVRALEEGFEEGL